MGDLSDSHVHADVDDDADCGNVHDFGDGHVDSDDTDGDVGDIGVDDVDIDAVWGDDVDEVNK